MGSEAIKSLANQWLDIDPNPTTRDQVESLLKEANFDELDKLLSTRILFGTAGLRSKMEAGFNRLNDVTVLQSSQGLAQYIIDCSSDIKGERSIVIGHDHRHNSKRFAELTATAFLIKGFKVYYLGGRGPLNEDSPDVEDEVVATPLIPFGVDLYGALGGIMITASHNPALDNGYKVYWRNGCQIINPHDVNIQNCILENLAIDKSHWDTAKVFSKYQNRLVGCRNETIDKYIVSLEKKLIDFKLPQGIKAVYTPMHGVGQQFVDRIMQKLSDHAVLEIVEEQTRPDPDFPTVKFPNPEEKGAMDMAKSKADRLGLDLVISNDPDADRFSCCIKLASGEWKQLTGNEIGFLFADYTIKRLKSKKENRLSDVYLVNSTVSSQMIKSMADVEGFHYEDTLTGFKWIGNKAIDLEKAGYRVPFAYEEAIGYMFDVVHDKDGISALVVFLQMYSHWSKNNEDAMSILEKGYLKYGYFKECNGYYLVPDLSITAKIFNENIRVGGGHPKTLGDYEVLSWRDLTIGYDSTTVDHKPTLLSDPTSQMITVTLKPKEFGGNTTEIIRFTARGSGTEPKLKVYIESKASDINRADHLSKDVWQILKSLWFKPDLYNLKEVV